jgi:hypothetical protein
VVQQLAPQGAPEGARVWKGAFAQGPRVATLGANAEVTIFVSGWVLAPSSQGNIFPFLS